MPKIVSRSQGFASEDAEESKEFHVYYCVCGSHALTVECRIDALPKRKTDQSRVLVKDKVTFKHYLQQGESKLLKREKGIEKQYRLKCKQCNLFIMYTSNPKAEEAKSLYIVEGSLVHSTSTRSPYQYVRDVPHEEEKEKKEGRKKGETEVEKKEKEEEKVTEMAEAQKETTQTETNPQEDRGQDSGKKRPRSEDSTS